MIRPHPTIRKCARRLHSPRKRDRRSLLKRGAKRPVSRPLQSNAWIKDYGWAARPIRQLLRLNPDLSSFMREPSPQTLHYVALCLIGIERPATSHRQPVTLRDLSESIASQPRRALLNDIHGADLGPTKSLARLGPTLLERDAYDLLAAILRDPLRRAAWRDADANCTLRLRQLATATTDDLQTFRGQLIAHYGGAGLRFILDGFQTLRPDLPRDDLIRRINALEVPTKMDKLAARLARNLDLPAHPWDGNGWIKPLRSTEALSQTGIRLNNCLASYFLWTEAMTGDRAFYLIEGQELCVVALARHRLFGTWFVHSLARRANQPPSPATKSLIIDAFAEAGFPYFDGAPISDVFVGGDGL